MDSIDVKVAIQRKNLRFAEDFRGGNQGGVGKIHRRVAVLVHQFAHAFRFSTAARMNLNQAVHQEAPEFVLSR